MPVVRMPDGTKVRFPDDMPDDQIRSMIQQKFPEETAALGGGAPAQAAPVAEPGAPAPEPEQPGWTVPGQFIAEAVGGLSPRGLKMGVQDVGTGLAELAFGVPDLFNMGINLGAAGIDAAGNALGYETDVGRLGMPSDVVTRHAGEAADAIGFDRVPWEDRSAAERGIGHMTRMATQFGGAAGGLAKTAADPTSPISQGIASIVPESLLRAPRKAFEGQHVGGQFATDTATGAGAGVGISGAENFMPQDMEGTALGGVMTMLGSILGGTTGAGVASGVKGAGSAGIDIAQRATGQGYERDLPQRPGGGHYTKREADQAATAAQLEADNPRGALSRAQEVEDELSELSGDIDIPVGQRPTTGAASQDLGLIQNELRARMDPKSRNQFIERDKNIRSRALDEVDAIAPRETVDVMGRRQPVDSRDFTDRAERLASTKEEQAARGVQQAEGQAEGVAKARAARGEELQSRRGQKEPASSELDRQFRETLGEEEATRRQLFNDPEMLAEPVDPEKLVDTARAIEADVGPIAAPEGVPGGFLSRIKSLEEVDPETGDVVGYKDLTFKDAQDMRSDVSGAIAEARKANNGPLAHRLIQLKSTLDSYTADLAEGGAAPRAGSGREAASVHQEYADMIDEALDASTSERLPPAFRARVDAVRNASDNKSLRKAVRDLEQAADMADDNNVDLPDSFWDVMDLLTSADTRIRSEIGGPGGATPPGRSSGAQNAAQRALANERENFAPRFREGQAAKQRQALKSGDETRTRPSEFGDKFLRRTEDAQSLGRALNFEGNPEAVKNARNWLGGKLAESGVLGSDRAIKPSALQSWREKNRGVLKAVPGADAEVAKILKQAQRGEKLAAEYGGNVRAAREAAKGVERQTKSGPLGKIAGKDPVNAIDSVLRSGDSERNMEALVKQVGNDRKALDGMKTALKEYVFERKTGSAVQQTADGRRPVGWAHFDDMMMNHDKALAKVLSPDEMNRMRAAHKWLRPLKELEQRGTVGSDTAEKVSIMSEQSWKLATVLARIKFGILKGGGVMRTAKDALAQLPNRNEAVRELSAKLHLDPRVRDHLLSREIKLGAPEWNFRLNLLLGAAEGGRETYGRKPLEVTIGRPAHWD